VHSYQVTDFAVGILIAASPSVLKLARPLYGFSVQRRQDGKWDPTPNGKLRLSDLLRSTKNEISNN
jgi:hypothetical protein